MTRAKPGPNAPPKTACPKASSAESAWPLPQATPTWSMPWSKTKTKTPFTAATTGASSGPASAMPKTLATVRSTTAKFMWIRSAKTPFTRFGPWSPSQTTAAAAGRRWRPTATSTPTTMRFGFRARRPTTSSKATTADSTLATTAARAGALPKTFPWLSSTTLVLTTSCPTTFMAECRTTARGRVRHTILRVRSATATGPSFTLATALTYYPTRPTSRLSMPWPRRVPLAALAW